MEKKSSSPQKGSLDSSSFHYQDEDETEPLNFPFFSVIVCKSHIKTPYTLYVPAAFNANLSSQAKHVVLTLRGKTWGVDCTRREPGCRILSSGWKNFATENNLNVGDGCVFELVDQHDEVATFKVQILRGDIPKGFQDKMDSAGVSKDDPIIL